jgi:ribosomal-protein-serine acetyltransferase
MNSKRDLSDLILQVDHEIALRLPQMEEAEALFVLVEANREHLRRFLFWVDYNRSLDSSLTFIRESLEKASLGEELHMVIEYQGKIVGTCGFHQIDSFNQKTEIGYWLAKEYEGRGIVHRAAKKLIAFAFCSLGLHRIELRSAVENIKSQRLAERLNFRFEGIARQSCKLPSGFHDMRLYSLLATDSHS